MITIKLRGIEDSVVWDTLDLSYDVPAGLFRAASMNHPDFEVAVAETMQGAIQRCANAVQARLDRKNGRDRSS